MVVDIDAIEAILNPFIEKYQAQYGKARGDNPDGAEVYGSGRFGVVTGLMIAKAQLRKALSDAPTWHDVEMK